MSDASATSPSAAPSPRGRLKHERLREIYSTVIAQLAENGFERLRLDQVAEDARCSKATLYRVWDGKLDLVVSALRCDVDGEGAKNLTPPPDTGSLRGDLHAWADQYVAQHSPFVSLLLGLARAALDDPRLARAVSDRAISGESGRLRHIVAAAEARGEITADGPALALLPQMLAGPALLHDILTGEPVSTSSLHAYIDAVVLPALGAPLDERES